MPGVGYRTALICGQAPPPSTFLDVLNTGLTLQARQALSREKRQGVRWVSPGDTMSNRTAVLAERPPASRRVRRSTKAPGVNTDVSSTHARGCSAASRLATSIERSNSDGLAASVGSCHPRISVRRCRERPSLSGPCQLHVRRRAGCSAPAERRVSTPSGHLSTGLCRVAQVRRRRGKASDSFANYRGLV